MRSFLLSSIAVGAMALSGTAFAQSTDNMEALTQMKTTSTKMEAFAPVPQNDEYAAQLRKNLEQIKLPAGFKINLYAVVPDARHMAVGPQGVVTFVGTRQDAVWAVTA